jgi:hypothetical protein
MNLDANQKYESGNPQFQTTRLSSNLTEAGLLMCLTEDRKYVMTEREKQFLALFKETTSLPTTTAYDSLTLGSSEQQEQEVTLHK